MVTSAPMVIHALMTLCWFYTTQTGYNKCPEHVATKERTMQVLPNRVLYKVFPYV